MGNSKPDDSETPALSNSDDVLQFLDSTDCQLPADQLTLKKIKDGSEGWVIGDEAFSFEIERHPTPFPSHFQSPIGETPARWHEQRRYSYDLTSGDWDVDILDREFRYDRHLLIQAEFEKMGATEVWEAKVERVQSAADPEAALETEFAPLEERYRDWCYDVPDEKVEEMLKILKEEFRRQAVLD